MSKFEIRSPLLIAAAVALTPALAFAEGDPSRPGGTTTTTTTTTSPSDSSSSSASDTGQSKSGQGSSAQGSSAQSGSSSSEAAMNRQGVAPPHEPSIDPAQVQKVFGMDVALIELKSLNSDQIKQLQQRLSERGFYRGKVDGVMGPQTKNALSGLLAQQFALNQRLVNQGRITQQFASSIGLDSAGRTPVSGVDVEEPSPAAPPRTEPAPAVPRNQPEPRSDGTTPNAPPNL